MLVPPLVSVIEVSVIKNLTYLVACIWNRDSNFICVDHSMLIYSDMIWFEYTVLFSACLLVYQVFSYYNWSKLTFQICITKWHLNYSYVTLSFVANIDASYPLAIMHVLKPANSWRIVCGRTSWVDLILSMYAGFTRLTRVDMLIIKCIYPTWTILN